MFGTLRPGSGGLLVTLGWPARLRGTAADGPAGGVVGHGVPYADSVDGCVCRRFGCGGLAPVGWCAEHGNAAGPAMDWHPGGGLRCTSLARRRTAAVHG
ncbi:hypothetical protein ACIRBY_24895 [Streptomyces sp. NPDC096136]|uniref:hypothetical protein n=1 Tax=Streptomyces sp. NPDC096136 TaxID=3366076 RepID=UPI0037F727AF